VRFYFIIIHPATEGHETETRGKGKPGEEFLVLFFSSYSIVSLQIEFFDTRVTGAYAASYDIHIM
jgi:hypothetical protein